MLPSQLLINFINCRNVITPTFYKLLVSNKARKNKLTIFASPHQCISLKNRSYCKGFDAFLILASFNNIRWHTRCDIDITVLKGLNYCLWSMMNERNLYDFDNTNMTPFGVF